MDRLKKKIGVILVLVLTVSILFTSFASANIFVDSYNTVRDIFGGRITGRSGSETEGENELVVAESCDEIREGLLEEEENGVRLNRDITVDRGRCFTIRNNDDVDNKVLDCDDHSINANGNYNDAVAIYLINTNNFTVKNCKIEGFRQGVRIRDGDGGNSENNKVVDNEFKQIWLSAVQVDGHSSDNTIEGNSINGTFENNRDKEIHSIGGIRVFGGEDNKIIDNEITNTGRENSDIDYSAVSMVTKNSDNLEIRENDVHDNIGRGLWYSGDNGMINDNNFTNNGNEFIRDSNPLEGPNVRLRRGEGIEMDRNRIEDSWYGLHIMKVWDSKISNLVVKNSSNHPKDRVGAIHLKYDESRHPYEIEFSNIHSCNDEGENRDIRDYGNPTNSHDPNTYSNLVCEGAERIHSGQGEIECDGSCEEKEKCLDYEGDGEYEWNKLDNDGDFDIGCEDDDCDIDEGSCGEKECNSDYEWDTSRDESKVGTCQEIEEEDGEFTSHGYTKNYEKYNCIDVTNDSGKNCEGECTECRDGECEAREKYDNSECGEDEYCPGLEKENENNTCQEFRSDFLCGDGECDSPYESVDNCSWKDDYDCKECNDDENCSDDYDEEYEFNNGVIEEIEFEGICEDYLCEKNETKRRDWTSVGDSSFCSNKIEALLGNCSYEEYVCNTGQCGEDEEGNELFCKGEEDKGCCREEEDWNGTSCYEINHTKQCHDGDVYWYDEIGGIREEYETCGSNDVCSDGSCVPGACKDDDDCSDVAEDKECLDYECNSSNECEYPVLDEYCSIGGECYSDGDLNENNDCEICNSSSNKTEWSQRSEEEICNNSCGSLCGYNCSEYNWPDGNTCNDSDWCTVGSCGEENECQYELVSEDTYNDTCEELGYECGDPCDDSENLDEDCDFSCGNCTEIEEYGEGYSCNSSYQCQASECDGDSGCEDYEKCNNGLCEPIVYDLNMNLGGNSRARFERRSNGDGVARGGPGSLGISSQDVRERNLDLDINNSKGKVIFTKINFSNDSDLDVEFFDDLEEEIEGKDFVSGISSSYSEDLNFDNSKITLKGDIDDSRDVEICKCEDFGGSECGGDWDCDIDEEDLDFADNDTHYWFDVDEFSAYAGVQSTPEGPDIELISPDDGEELLEGDVDFEYSASHDSEVENCSLYIGENLNSTHEGDSVGDNFTVYMPDRFTNPYSWEVECYSEEGVKNESEGRNLTVSECYDEGDCSGDGVCDTDVGECVDSGTECEEEGYECMSECGDGYEEVNYDCDGDNKCCNETTTCDNECEDGDVEEECDGSNTVKSRSCEEGGDGCFDWSDWNYTDCGDGEVCSNGECVDNDTCDDTCDSLDYECGQICGENCGSCGDGEVCESGECICQEDWNCTDWSECEDGEKTRECEDLNDCNTTEDKPSETESCDTDNDTDNDTDDCEESCSYLGYECGVHDVCGEPTDCGSCGEGQECSGGECYETDTCDDTCDSLDYECGNHTICGEETDCGSCGDGEVCESGECVEEESNTIGKIAIVLVVIVILAAIGFIIYLIGKEMDYF